MEVGNEVEELLNGYKSKKDVPAYVIKWIKKQQMKNKTFVESSHYIRQYGWDDEAHEDFKIYEYMNENGDLLVELWVDEKKR